MKQGASDNFFSPLQWLVLFFIVGITANATITLQLVATRILSVLYYNHLVYLAVTLAMLGIGTSGVLMAILAPRIKSMVSLVRMGLMGGAISIPVCIGASSYVPHFYNEEVSFYAQENCSSGILLKLAISYLLVTVPFVFLGLILASIFTMAATRITQLYFFDLAASAFGTIGFVLLITPLGAEGLIWYCSGILAVAVILVQIGFGGSRITVGLCLLALGGIAAVSESNLIGSEPDYSKVGSIGIPKFHLEQVRWTTIAKIEVMDGRSFWSALAPGFPEMERKLITQDRDAVLYIWSPQYFKARVDSAQSDHPFINGEAMSFIVHPGPADALIIGVGGGNDIVNAVAFKGQHITGVEINPQTISLMTREYSDYAVWPKYPNVKLVCMDGRNFVASTADRFDTVNISGIDTFSALSTGAYVLSENYLYTVEAIKNYLKVLKPQGVVNIFRWNFRVPRESLRLCNLFLEASRENGNPHPEQCVMIVGAESDSKWDDVGWASMLIKNEPFTKEEVNRVLAQSERQSSLPIIYIPKIFSPDEQAQVEAHAYAQRADYYKPNRDAFASLINAPNQAIRDEFVNSYPYNVTPVYDDRPFFFEYHKMTEWFQQIEPNGFSPRGIYVHYTLYFLLAVTLLASYIGMILPLQFFEKDGLKVPNVRFLIGFFGSLGFGFMFVELGVIQSLTIYLGHPMYSLGLVLSSLLLATGLGSYLSGLRQASIPVLLRDGTVGSAVAIVMWVLVMPWVASETMGCSIWTRGTLTSIGLIPLGLTMGIPFATGIRYVNGLSSRFVPWAWGINGLTSVMASILAIILAMRIGFHAVLLIGALTYLLGYAFTKKFLVT